MSTPCFDLCSAHEVKLNHRRFCFFKEFISSKKEEEANEEDIKSVHPRKKDVVVDVVFVSVCLKFLRGMLLFFFFTMCQIIQFVPLVSDHGESTAFTWIYV